MCIFVLYLLFFLADFSITTISTSLCLFPLVCELDLTIWFTLSPISIQIFTVWCPSWRPRLFVIPLHRRISVVLYSYHAPCHPASPFWSSFLSYAVVYTCRPASFFSYVVLIFSPLHSASAHLLFPFIHERACMCVISPRSSFKMPGTGRRNRDFQRISKPDDTVHWGPTLSYSGSGVINKYA